jgi:drug/metabolite transporter (DMT)-like permease
MRRVIWTVCLGLVGFGLGWFGQQGQPLSQVLLAILTVWGSCIGYGFGSIFDQGAPRGRLIVYWIVTVALGALLFCGFVPFRSFSAKLATAALIGALLGALIGIIHLSRLSPMPKQNEQSIASPRVQ